MALHLMQGALVDVTGLDEAVDLPLLAQAGWRALVRSSFQDVQKQRPHF
jgi:hypothetical protein